MIQRKQTLFLFFSAIIMIGYIFSPVIRLEGAGPARNVDATEIMRNIDFPIIGHYFVFVCAIAAGITAGINLLTIFLYRQRKLQVALSWISIIPAIFCFCWVYYRMTHTEMAQDQIFWYGNISPLVSAVFIIIAIFYIQKDEQLVKSVDRLR